MAAETQHGISGDEFDATRVIVRATEQFDEAVRLRIFRLAAAALGLRMGPETSPAPMQAAIERATGAAKPELPKAQDIKAFLEEKKPHTDQQKAVAVAYYFRFVAPEGQRKMAVGPNDLQDAMRLANLGRFKKPAIPLNNAVQSGLLDRGERGLFTINAVGENLVAMLLPDVGVEGPRVRTRKRAKNGKPRKA